MRKKVLSIGKDYINNNSKLQRWTIILKYALNNNKNEKEWKTVKINANN